MEIESNPDLVGIITDLEALEWRFAKTMPTIPHYHFHFSRASGIGQAKRLMELAGGIEEYGEKYRWRTSKPRSYLFANGWMYWFMEPAAKDATLINRQEINEDHMAQLTYLGE